MSVNNAPPSDLTDTMIKIGRVSFIVLLYIFGGLFFLFGKQFVFLWVGKWYSDSYIIALMIMIAYTIPLVHKVFTGALIEAKNKVAFKSIVYLIFLGFKLLGFFLAKKYSAIGMISRTVIGWIIAQNIMNVFL